jgi:transposase InsO family protein
LISLEEYDTHEAAQTAVFEYIEVFYNRQRCHSANGYLAPLVYEQALKTSSNSRRAIKPSNHRDLLVAFS